MSTHLTHAGGVAISHALRGEATLQREEQPPRPLGQPFTLTANALLARIEAREAMETGSTFQSMYP